jgi:hypothetical protein
MEFKASKAIAMVLAGMLCMASSHSMAKGKPGAVRYPAALQGVWLGGRAEYCKRPDSLDSDSRFEVTPAKLIGYEHWNKPLRIVQLSKEPAAWKVISQTHFEDQAASLEEVYVLSGYKGDTLTIVNSSQSHTYHHCR